MIVTITRLEQDICSSLEISEDTTIDILKCLIESDLNIPKEKQMLFYNSKPVRDNSITVGNIGVSDGSVIVVQTLEGVSADTKAMTNMNVNENASFLPLNLLSLSNKNNNREDPETLKILARRRALDLLELCEKDKSVLGGLFNRNIQLAEALKSKNICEITDVIFEQEMKQKQAEQERAKRLQEVLLNPLTIESQKFLEDQLRQQQLDESYQLAHEYLPETFGDVFMVYVDMEVNGVPLKAFVDSGAQATIMSKSCAEKCNLMRFVDKRFQGIAQGVGTSRIVGRIHLAQLKIGDSFFPASFTVIEDDKIDFLFGLDMLRRYQSCLDFKKNVLRIGKEEVPFLSEKDLKQNRFGNLSANGSCIKTIKNESSCFSSPSFSSSSFSKNTTITQSSTFSSLKAINSNSSYSQDNYGKMIIEKENGQDKKISDREVALKSLMELGFSREASENAFSQAGENAELAASLLFQQF